MDNSIFLTRVVLRNYKSIGYCDVPLSSLTYLVGTNGSGKSNFLDALHFVKDSLSGSLDQALTERGGLAEVRRRSSGHPRHFGIRLEFKLRGGDRGYYSFDVGALADRGYEVQNEECAIGAKGKGPFYKVERGALKGCSENVFPAITSDRLALVSVSGMTVFRPVFDALTCMGFYNLNPKLMRDPQKPQDGRQLRPVGENIASVIGHLERVSPDGMRLIQEYLQTVVPTIQGVERKQIGPMETLEFLQTVSGARHPWKFPAQNMSDGTMRALGILTALFQGNRDHAPTLIGIEEPETALHPAASAALRDALALAKQRTQVIVTSHSPDLLNDSAISSDALLSVVSIQGETKIAPLDQASRQVMQEHLFSAGELLRLNQLAPDMTVLEAQESRQASLFGAISE